MQKKSIPKFGKDSFTLDGDPDTYVPLADEKDWDLDGHNLFSFCHLKGFQKASLGLVRVEIFWGIWNGVCVRFGRGWNWKIEFELSRGTLILTFLKPALVFKW